MAVIADLELFQSTKQLILHVVCTAAAKQRSQLAHDAAKHAFQAHELGLSEELLEIVAAVVCDLWGLCQTLCSCSP